ncbi:hypothetical protein MRX96_001055 [Rhipicephalus microplus]
MVWCVVLAFHVGSTNQDPGAFTGALAAARRTFDAGRDLGFDLRLLDIGGGYPGEKGLEHVFLKDNEEPLHPSIVWGITCDGVDKIKAVCKLPELAVGEWLYFESMGAYTITINSPFNGFPMADVHYRASKIVEDHLRRKKLILSILDTA